MAPLGEMDLDGSNIGEASAADWNFSVPDASLCPIHPVTSLASAAIAGSGIVDVAEKSSSRETNGKHHLSASPVATPVISYGGEGGASEEVFAVPQLPCVPRSNKRPCRPWALNF